MENLLSEMEWGEENILKLISLYREQQVLWNQTIPDYKNKNMKTYTWNDISREMNLSKAEVQNKMRNLIIQFNREAKKGNKSGSGADDGKTKWKFFQPMMFLKDKTTPRQARETAGEQEAIGPQETDPSGLLKYSANSFRISFASSEGFLGIRFRRRSIPWGIPSTLHWPGTRIPLSSSLSYIPEGLYDALDDSLLLKKLCRDEFILNTEWHEAIVSVTIGTAWIFSLVSGWLTDKYGRKPVILFASLVFTAGSLIMGLANGKEMLLVGRAVVGMGIGLVSMAVPVYIAESAMAEDRGRLVTINNLFITGGQFLASVICGGFSTVPDGWRYMLGLAAVPACIQFFGFLGMPETPRWLVSHNKLEQAEEALRIIRGDGVNIQDELEAIKAACREQAVEVSQREANGSKHSVWLQVFTTSYTRRALFLGVLLQSAQQLSGINTVMYYSASIIQMAGVKSYSLAIWLAAATASVNFFCTFIGLVLVDRVGRRPLTLWSLGGVIISLVTLGIGFWLMNLDSPVITIAGDGTDCIHSRTCGECVAAASNCGFCYFDLNGSVLNGSCWEKDVNNTLYSLHGPCSQNMTLVEQNQVWAADWCPSQYSWVAVAALGLYLLFFAPGMGPMPWTINSEIYPTWARSFCSSVATSFNMLFNLFISMTFLTFTELLTKEGAFYLYAGLATACFIVLLLILPETKDKTLEEMEVLFTGAWCSRTTTTDAKNIQYVHIRGMNWAERRDVDDSGESDS